MLARAAQGRRVATSSLTARAARCIHASVRCSPAGALPENRASGSQIAAGAKLVEAVVGQPPRLEPDAQLVIAPVALLGMITSHTCPRFRRVGNTDNRPFVAGSTPLSPLRSCARRAVTRVRCPWCLPACMPQAPPGAAGPAHTARHRPDSGWGPGTAHPDPPRVGEAESQERHQFVNCK